MITLPPDLSSDDAHQWLSGGVFLAMRPQDEEWVPAGFAGAPGPGIIRVEYVDNGQREQIGYSGIRPYWPECGAITMRQGFALYVQRLQRRQYRRTFNARCVNITVPGKWQCLKMLSARDMRVDAGSREFLTALFNPTYPENMGEIQSRLRETASLAINPRVIFVGNPSPAVYYRGQLAGRMIGDNFMPECDEVTCRSVREELEGLI